MKKEIERVAHLPIRQQSWSGLMGAKDSVIYKIKKNKFLSILIVRRMNYIVHPLIVKLILLYVK